MEGRKIGGTAGEEGMVEEERRDRRKGGRTEQGRIEWRRREKDRIMGGRTEGQGRIDRRKREEGWKKGIVYEMRMWKEEGEGQKESGGGGKTEGQGRIERRRKEEGRKKRIVYEIRTWKDGKTGGERVRQRDQRSPL